MFVAALAILILNLLYSRFLILIGKPEIATGNTTSILFIFSDLLILISIGVAWRELKKIKGE